MKTKSLVIPLFGLAALLAFVLFSLSTSPVAAGTLPPRPETPAPPSPAPPPPPVQGGVIVLQQTGEALFPAGAWTVVQWQTALGTWADVEGWQGSFNNRNQVIWWVAPGNLGEGSFRWLVYASEARTELLATSEKFDLPGKTGEVVTVPISLGGAE